MISSLFCMVSCNNEETSSAPIADANNNAEMYIAREPNAISVSDANKIAALFNGGAAKTRSVGNISTQVVLDNATNTPLLYIVNYGQNNGYVIISASKNTPPILAYSDNGKFEVFEDCPAAIYLDEFKEGIKVAKQCGSDTLRLKYALQWAAYEKKDLAENTTRALSYEMQQKLEKEVAYRESLGYIYLGGLSAAQYYLPSETYELLLKQMKDCTDPQYDYMETAQLFIKSYDYEVIDKMLKTEWSQREPFNIDAKNGLAGCTPIAVAQIVYFHKFPNKYNWNNIYEYPILNDDFKFFIKDIRSLCKVEYKKEGTESNIEKAKSALQNLGYDVKITDNDIQSTLRTQIHSGNPVYIRGNNSDGEGHAWVCDGYMNKKYDAITTYLPNKSDPRFKREPTSPQGFAAYELSIYPISSLDGGHYGEFFHMNLGWGGSYNGWYRTATYIPSLNSSFVFNQKVLTIKR